MTNNDSKPATHTTHTPYDPKLSHIEATHSISSLGIKKANTEVWQLFLLAVLAGIYIAFGAQVFLVALQQGMGKVMGGAVFSVGLVLVIVAGAELFTGNIIMIVGAISHYIPLHRVLRNWSTVYLGNFVGSVLFAVAIWKSGLLGHAGEINALGELSAKIADAKLAIPFGEAVIRGIFCNILVILAIILATISKDVISKILACMLPIMTFVACGFEHCVANMYLIPLGLFAKGTPIAEHWIMFNNIIPVTIGNIIGGFFILLIHPNRIRQFKFLTSRKKKTEPPAT